MGVGTVPNNEQDTIGAPGGYNWNRKEWRTEEDDLCPSMVLYFGRDMEKLNFAERYSSYTDHFGMTAVRETSW